MAQYYASETYIEAFKKIEEACCWLEELGIEYSKTRLGRYKQIFEVLAKHQQSNTLEQAEKEFEFNAFVNAAHEVAEIVRLYEGLSGQKDQSFVARLKDSIKGQELYVLDSDGRSGRDFTFELAIASKFVKAGYFVDFGHDADLKAVRDGMTVFVECKRLKSNKKVQRRIKDGLKQLHKRYVKSDDPQYSRGFLALSIGKLVNKNLGLLEADDPHRLGQKAFAHNRKFITEFGSHWQNVTDKRTLGTVVVLDTPGVLAKERQLITCHEVTINNSVPQTSPDYELLFRIGSDVFPRKK